MASFNVTDENDGSEYERQAYGVCCCFGGGGDGRSN